MIEPKDKYCDEENNYDYSFYKYTQDDKVSIVI